MRLVARAIFVLAVYGLAAGAYAAEWKQVAKARAGALWIDVESIKRNEGEIAFDYRLDFPKPQREVGSKVMYRSTVTRAIVRCQTRAFAMGFTQAYDGPAGTGKLVGRYPPSPEEARFQPVQKQSTDENLWRYVCQVPEPQPKKK